MLFKHIHINFLRFSKASINPCRLQITHQEQTIIEQKSIAFFVKVNFISKSHQQNIKVLELSPVFGIVSLLDCGDNITDWAQIFLVPYGLM